MVNKLQIPLVLLLTVISCSLLAQNESSMRIIALGTPDSEDSVFLYPVENHTIVVKPEVLRNEIVNFDNRIYHFNFQPLLDILDGTPEGELIEAPDGKTLKNTGIYRLLFDLVESSRGYILDNRTGEYVETVQGGTFRDSGSAGRKFMKLDGETIAVYVTLHIG